LGWLWPYSKILDKAASDKLGTNTPAYIALQHQIQIFFLTGTIHDTMLNQPKKELGFRLFCYCFSLEDNTLEGHLKVLYSGRLWPYSKMLDEPASDKYLAYFALQHQLQIYCKTGTRCNTMLN
jgi:hypothetical protein